MSSKIKEALEKIRKAGEKLRENSIALNVSVVVLTETQHILERASAKLGQAAEKLYAASMMARSQVITLEDWLVYYTGRSNLITVQDRHTMQVHINLRFNVENATFEDERAPDVSWTDRQIIAHALADLRAASSKELAN